MEIIRKRTPLAQIIDDPMTPAPLRDRLEMVRNARQFAIDELLLPDNKSYQTFADLERDFVLWNVMAAPEFSLQPKTWCYPIVGCVAYRGYFAKENADKRASKLSDDGYDVFVGGVAAYSTLGRFADPVLNTMMRWSDADLVAVLFHELAHQRLFIKGDTAFNESFATAVAEIGVERWLGKHGKQSEIAEYRGRGELRRSLMSLVEVTKVELESLYASDMGEDVKRELKEEILQRLSTDAEQIIADQSFEATNWLRAPLNNARLVSLVLYRGQLDAFRDILKRCDGVMACFYQSVDRLADLPVEERAAMLDAAVVARR